MLAAANGSVKARQLAAMLIPKFFKYFPQISEQALDQYLYLCEDDELGVSCLTFRCWWKIWVIFVVFCYLRRFLSHSNLHGLNSLKI